MQILEAILYGINGETRTIPFTLGKVNIITGTSRTGKSALGDIISYCLGGANCKIADGVIREKVLWYGLLLQFDGERVFVARQSPTRGKDTTNQCYFEVGEKINAPQKGTFLPNTTVEAVEVMLSKRLGIKENLHIPSSGQTRQPLEANIRHALVYSFQNQDEIASKTIFHRQNENAYMSQAIKDTMLYFLGILNEEALIYEQKKAGLQRELNKLKRTYEEQRNLRTEGSYRAIGLISEAKEVGLYSAKEKINHEDFFGVHKILKEINKWKPGKIEFTNLDRLGMLQDQFEILEKRIDEINEELSNAARFSENSLLFVEEANQQKVRLESVKIFEKIDRPDKVCPFCFAQNSDQDQRNILEDIRLAAVELEKQIGNTTMEEPRIRKYIDKLNTEKQDCLFKMENLKKEIDGIYDQNKDARELRDYNTRCAKVVGRISLWLESASSHQDASKYESRIKELEKEIFELNALLDQDQVEERKQAAISNISMDMTNWADELEMEHKGFPYRLDMKSLTIKVDKPERSVPLAQIGSGSNWIGIHLLAYFSLQKFFVLNRRPVPRFLFLDQPSQVYFQSELDEKKTDLNAVKKIYDFIFNRVDELKGKFQVIVVDHANLGDNKFQSATVEVWNENKKLVPKSWIEDEQ